MNAARRARRKAAHHEAKQRKKLERKAAQAAEPGDLMKHERPESEKAAAQTALAKIRRIRKKLSDGDNLPE